MLHFYLLIVYCQNSREGSVNIALHSVLPEQLRCPGRVCQSIRSIFIYAPTESVGVMTL